MDISSGKSKRVVIVTSIKDITGKKFGKLTVLKLKFLKNHKTYWLCQCKCGNTKVIRKDHLLSGATQSCGCLEKSNLKKLAFKPTHGHSSEPIYFVWNTMRQRCTNHNANNYKNYGARGIKVCDEWLKNFENFYEWAMAHGYRRGLTIDRIDVNGNYEPSNCRWVSQKVQQNNRRNNHVIDGKTVTQWAESKSINPQLVSQRLRKGWSLKQALDKNKHVNQFI